MKARAGFSNGDLGCKCYIETLALRKIAYHPLGEHQLIGGIAGVDRQEFDFILLIHHSVEGEITNFGVAIFNLGTGAGYVAHAQRAEIVEFRERSRFVVAALVGSWEGATVGGYHVVFELSHGIECKAGHLGECTASLVEHALGSRFKLVAILIEVRAQHG